MTPKPYESALTSRDLTAEEYKALTDDLKKKKKKKEKDAAKKVQKEQKKTEKVVKAVESDKGKGTAKVMEAALVDEEKRMDVDTKRETLETSKEKAFKKLREV
ncbi:hypothetical protein ARMSODRAFT_982622 [Armillaria solidipes]|uniref:Uncharacterized protein n=1 Tax=Armillaria solidipes TaxID=1076256 RepID=A0A2H3B235_9AGAR|nr:hypothetical protein ARMSODRAFT_982622 [Armillaria solidipes]